MQKRYQYCMSGMFAATDQNHYEINIPSPHTYETEEEAMADGAFGYRFVLLPGGKGPQVVIFEGSGFRLVCDGKENYIKDWVEGDIVGIYDFDEFTKAGGYIRLLNPELGDNVCIIEDVLYQNLFGSNPCLAREYGTKEVTVTLLKEKKVKEIVDFLSYNAKKDEFRCYEIKVSMADFKSKAAKTWIGNYNYLVIPRELYLKQSLYEWKEQIPYYVGIIVVNVERRSKWVAKRPTPMEVSAGMKFMLRQSLIRTLFYQNDKLKKNSAAKIEQICQETEK